MLLAHRELESVLMKTSITIIVVIIIIVVITMIITIITIITTIITVIIIMVIVICYFYVLLLFCMGDVIPRASRATSQKSCCRH